MSCNGQWLLLAVMFTGWYTRLPAVLFHYFSLAGEQVKLPDTFLYVYFRNLTVFRKCLN